MLKRHRLARHQLADDLIGVGTLALLRAARTFDATRGFQFSTFATRCIRRAFGDWLDSQVKHRRCRQPDDDFHSLVDPDRGDAFHRRQERIACVLREAIDTLPPDDAELLRRRLDGEMMRAIGRTKGVTVETIRQRQLRAYRRLRELHPELAELLDD